MISSVEQKWPVSVFQIPATFVRQALASLKPTYPTVRTFYRRMLCLADSGEYFIDNALCGADGIKSVLKYRGGGIKVLYVPARFP